MCSFDLIVNPVTPPDILDIDGHSPLYVLEGDCQTLSVSCQRSIVRNRHEFKLLTTTNFQVKVIDTTYHLEANDFKWYKMPGDKEIDFSLEKYSKKNHGKSLKV